MPIATTSESDFEYVDADLSEQVPPEDQEPERLQPQQLQLPTKEPVEAQPDIVYIDAVEDSSTPASTEDGTEAVTGASPPRSVSNRDPLVPIQELSIPQANITPINVSSSTWDKIKFHYETGFTNETKSTLRLLSNIYNRLSGSPTDNQLNQEADDIPASEDHLMDQGDWLDVVALYAGKLTNPITLLEFIAVSAATGGIGKLIGLATKSVPYISKLVSYLGSSAAPARVFQIGSELNAFALAKDQEEELAQAIRSDSDNIRVRPAASGLETAITVATNYAFGGVVFGISQAGSALFSKLLTKKITSEFPDNAISLNKKPGPKPTSDSNSAIARIADISLDENGVETIPVFKVPLMTKAKFIPIVEGLSSQNSVVRTVTDAFLDNNFTNRSSSKVSRTVESDLILANQKKAETAIIFKRHFDIARKQKVTKNLTEREFLESLTNRIRDGSKITKDELYIPQVNASYHEIRKIMDEAIHYGKETGVLQDSLGTAYGEGYLPRIYNTTYIYENRSAWKEALYAGSKKSLQRQITTADLIKEFIATKPSPKVWLDSVKTRFPEIEIYKLSKTIESLIDNPKILGVTASKWTEIRRKAVNLINNKEELAKWQEAYFKDVDDTVFGRRLLEGTHDVSIDPPKGVVRTASIFKERVVDLTDDELKEFLVNDPHKLLDKFFTDMYAEAGIARVSKELGYESWDAVVQHAKQIEAAKTYAADAVVTPTTDAAQARSMQLLENLPNIVKGFVRGSYQQNANSFSKYVGNSIDFLANLSVLRHLGSLPFSLIADLCLGASKFGFKYLGRICETIFNPKRLTKEFSKDDVHAMGVAIEMLVEDFRFLPTQYTSNRVLDASRMFAQKFMKLTFMPQLDDWHQRVIASVLGSDVLRAIKVGEDVFKVTRLSKKAQANIISEIKRTSELDANGMHSFNVSQWNSDAVRDFGVYLREHISQAVIKPHLGSRPILQNNVSSFVYRLLTQFMNFEMALTTDVLMPLMHNKMFGQAASLIVFGFGFSVLRSYLQGYAMNNPYDIEDPELYKRAWDYMPLGIMTAASGSIVRLASGEMKLSTPYKLAYDLISHGPLHNLIDIYSAASSGVQSVSERRKLRPAEIKKMISLIPFNNMFYVKMVLDRLLPEELRAKNRRKAFRQKR
jgi:acetolactate synthase small subunit